MKKLVLLLVIALAAIGASAQTTFNIRAGVGVAQNKHDYYDTGVCFAPSVVFEMNVPLGSIGTSASKWVFSPSIQPTFLTDFEEFNIPCLLHFGYKALAGNNGLFIPKFGLMAGAVIHDAGSVDLIFGPSCEFAYETRHFVLAVNTYCSLAQCSGFGAFLTFGYKF
ncbi:MAG: hypothetical protein ACI4A8_09075 [Muribaculaceae bacterium]